MGFGPTHCLARCPEETKQTNHPPSFQLSNTPSPPHHLFYYDMHRRYRHQEAHSSIYYIPEQKLRFAHRVGRHKVNQVSKQISTDYHRKPLATQETNGEHQLSSSSASTQASASCFPRGTAAPVPMFLGRKVLKIKNGKLAHAHMN